MWRKFGRYFVVCLLLLAVFTPLGAWPASWSFLKKGASASPAEAPVQTQLEQQLLTELQTELDGLKQIISNSQQTIAKQSAELIALKASSSVFAVNHETLKGEYDALKIAYEALVNQPTVSEYKSPWGAVIGASAIMDKSGAIGAEISAGVSFKSYTLEFGLGYTPAVWKFAIPDPADFSYRGGIKFAF